MGSVTLAPVRLSPVGHAGHRYDEHAIGYVVKHAVVTDPHPVAIGVAGELLAPGRARVVAEGVDLRPDALLDVARQCLKLSPRGRAKLDPIAHYRPSSRFTCAQGTDGPGSASASSINRLSSASSAARSRRRSMESGTAATRCPGMRTGRRSVSAWRTAAAIDLGSLRFALAREVGMGEACQPAQGGSTGEAVMGSVSEHAPCARCGHPRHLHAVVGDWCARCAKPCEFEEVAR